MYTKIKNHQGENPGFTLIELLIVIVLLGFLTITGLSMFQGSQRRSRDMRRKNDLAQVAKALEMYANDYGYPTADSGKIKGCGTPTTTPPALTACGWGTTWKVTIGSTPVVYMQKLPKDPGNLNYCYTTVSKGYKLFAKLENTDDPDYNSSGQLTCGGTSYTYVLLSPNITPSPTP